MILPSAAYIGRKYGRLTVEEVLPADKHRHVSLKCKCDCGGEKIALYQNIITRKTASCGCLHRERVSEAVIKYHQSKEAKDARLRKAIEYRKSFIGKRFGRLIVTEITDITKKCRCKCDCGKEIITYFNNLQQGSAKSCGCLRIYRHPERNVGLRKLYYRYSFRSRKLHKEDMPIPLEEFKRLTSSVCHYCGSAPTIVMKSKSKYSEYLYNGLDRIDTNKGYALSNVVPCCWMCNTMKLDYTTEEFLSQINKIQEHQLKAKKKE